MYASHTLLLWHYYENGKAWYKLYGCTITWLKIYVYNLFEKIFCSSYKSWSFSASDLLKSLNLKGMFLLTANWSPCCIKSCTYHRCGYIVRSSLTHTQTPQFSQTVQEHQDPRVPTWSRARGGHVVDEVLQCCSNSDEGMVHGGVLFIGHPVVVVMVGPGAPGPQSPVAVADIKCHNKQQAEHTHRAGDHRCKGHGTQRRRLYCGDCRTERRQTHSLD